MDAREDLPKVSIETEQDWRRIQQNLSAALLARLETELESSGRTGDKDKLTPHVHQVRSLWFVPSCTKTSCIQFLDTLLDIARPNLRINGRTSSAEQLSGDEDGKPLVWLSILVSHRLRRGAVRRSIGSPYLVAIRPKIEVGQRGSRPSTLKTWRDRKAANGRFGTTSRMRYRNAGQL